MKRISLKARLGLTCGTVAAISSPLHADVTATFAGEGPRRMVVDHGSARVDMSNGGRLENRYTLIRDGMTYEVSPGPGHPTAISAEAQRYLFDASVRRGEIILSSDGPLDLDERCSRWLSPCSDRSLFGKKHPS